MSTGTKRGLQADAAMAASILLLGYFLCFTGVGLIEQWQFSAARRQAPDIEDLLGVFAVAAGVGIVAWWVFSMMLAGTAAILGRCGWSRAADKAGKYCPAFMRRLAVAALSVQLLSAPLANAAVPPAGPAWVPTQEVAAQGGAAPEVTIPAQWSPTATEPQITEVTAPAVRPEWRPSAPVADPGLLAARPVRAAQEAPPPGEVTVLAGETLWDIAAVQLGPTASDVDIALHWPRWYEANKTQIGENPHVLLPGQILKAPSTA